MEKLYVIVRNDLTPGLQCAQACHAQHLFTQRFPELARAWGQNLVVLQVPNEVSLEAVRADLEGISVVSFHEPDLDNELTAIAVAGDAERLLSSFPLALRTAA